jgi:hypothetical protein
MSGDDHVYAGSMKLKTEGELGKYSRIGESENA